MITEWRTKMKKNIIRALTLLLSVAALLAVLAITVGAADDPAFTTVPHGATVGASEGYTVGWQTNFAADEYKVMRFDGIAFVEYATVPYTEGIVTYTIPSCPTPVTDEDVSHLFTVEAYVGGAKVCESAPFNVNWSVKHRITYLAAGGTGEIAPVFVEDGAEYSLSFCYFEAPTGKRFSHWLIDGVEYGQFEDITVTKSMAVVACWLPTVDCLPLSIDASAIVGKKTPEEARLLNYLPDNDQIHFCSGIGCDVDCGMTLESDRWYYLDDETDTYILAEEFEDGKRYCYYLGIHPDAGYLLPRITEQETRNLAVISGIKWDDSVGVTMSSDNDNYQCYEAYYYITYDAEVGIPGENRTVIDEIVIDASSLGGQMTPAKLDPAEVDNDIYYLCDGVGCEYCDEEAAGMYNAWLDAMNFNIVDSFLDGKQYIFYLALHLKDGYRLPDDIDERTDFITLEGVVWDTAKSMGWSHSLVFMGITTYSAETGIPVPPHVCEPTPVEKSLPSCTEPGYEAHYVCECGKYYEDAEGTVEIPDLFAWGGTEATGHDFGDTYAKNADTHWLECDCGHTEGEEAHRGGTATCEKKAECEVCGNEYGELIAHTGGTATCESKAKCTLCGNEYGEKGEHKDADNNGKCDVCGLSLSGGDGGDGGNGGNGGEDIPAGEGSHAHSFSVEWMTTENEHYKECACGEKQYAGAHVDNNLNASCDVCGRSLPTESAGGLGTGAIVGIVVGSTAVVGIGAFALIWFVIKKKSFADLIAVFKR